MSFSHLIMQINSTNRQLKWIFISCIFLLSFLPQKSRGSEEPIIGEVINIDTEQAIVFTDLNNFYLDPGDILAVYRDSRIMAYLRVIETTSAISKMKLIDNDIEYRTDAGIDDLKIGDKVFKNPQDQNPMSKADSVDSQPPSPEAMMTRKSTSSKSNRNVAQNWTGDYDELLKKHTAVVKSLMTIKLEKEALESRNDILSEKLRVAIEEIKRLKLSTVQLQGEINRLADLSEEKICADELKKATIAIKNLKEKLKNIKNTIEGN